MITSFGNKLAEDLYFNKNSKVVKKFPKEIHRVARRKLLYLHDAAELRDLRIPPGNRLEKLKGDLSAFHSIRINDQWRVIFKWSNGNVSDVTIVDYH